MAANFIPQIPNGGESNFGNPQVSNNSYGMFTQPSYPPYNMFSGKIGTPQNTMQNQSQFLKCRPVSSKEEAIASQIDLDGSLWVFTDIANGKIYTKQINNDGTATFKTYAYTKDENPYSNSNYVTKEEFNTVIQSLAAAIQQNQSLDSNSKEKEQQPAAKIPSNF